MHPLVLQCLSNSSDNRPTSVVLCEALKKIGVVRKSALERIKAFQEERAGFTKRLEAFLLQKDSDMQKITRQQNTIRTLQTQQSTNQSTHQKMEQEIAALEEQNTSYQEQVIVLQSAKDELQQHINAIEQEKAMLNEQLRQLQQSGGVGSTDPEVSSLRDQLNQVTMERDNIQKQMASTKHFKSLLEGEYATQKATIAILQAQVALVEIREYKEKILVENAQLREIATQLTKCQHAVKENKQLKRDNQELRNALERAQTELQVLKENSMASKEQLDKATDQTTLNAITDKMFNYKTERDDAGAQVQALQERLHSGGGGASEDVVSKMSRYKEEQVQTQQAEIAKLNSIVTQMASTQASQPMAALYNRQTNDDQPSSLPSGHGDVFASESDQCSSISDVLSPHQTPSRHPDKGKATNLSAPRNPTPSKTSPQSAKKTSASGHFTKQTSKSIIKQVTTANGEESVSCEPVSSLAEVKKGQRVVVCQANSDECGTVRAVNVTIDAKNKGFIGVEMDLPSMFMMHKKYLLMFVFYRW